MTGRKVAVVGVSGSGKTTFAHELARKLDVPYVELDALNHLAGWREAGVDELRRRWRRQRRANGPARLGDDGIAYVRLRSPREVDAWMEANS